MDFPKILCVLGERSDPLKRRKMIRSLNKVVRVGGIKNIGF